MNNIHLIILIYRLNKIPFTNIFGLNKIQASFVTNTLKITSLFNDFFAQHCTLIQNSSMLPSFEYKINTRIDTVTFSEHNILSIIRSLNQNKAHGWD